MHTRIDDAYHLPSAIRSRAYIDSPSIAREFFVLLDSEARACPGQSSAMHSVRMIAHVRMLQPAIDRADLKSTERSQVAVHNRPRSSWPG